MKFREKKSIYYYVPADSARTVVVTIRSKESHKGGKIHYISSEETIPLNWEQFLFTKKFYKEVSRGEAMKTVKNLP